MTASYGADRQAVLCLLSRGSLSVEVMVGCAGGGFSGIVRVLNPTRPDLAKDFKVS